MADPAIEIRGLTKSYGAFTLGPLDLTVPTGAIYGFVGPNGAGKTTTIDLILGMGGKDAGSIRVNGLDHIRDEAAMKGQIGYVSPDLNYQSWMRVGNVIRFMRGFYPTWDDDYCARLMTTFGLGWKDYTMQLSFGARIKLALLLALSWKPRVLILDEPTVGLDAIAKREVFTELLAAVGEGDRTVFISSHALTDLERFADHVGMIRGGRLLVEGPTSDVVERYRMVDLIAPASARLADQAGMFIQRQDGERWRALLDQQLVPLSSLAARGATVIADAPVTLEEIFVALGKS